MGIIDRFKRVTEEEVEVINAVEESMTQDEEVYEEELYEDDIYSEESVTTGRGEVDLTEFSEYGDEEQENSIYSLDESIYKDEEPEEEYGNHIKGLDEKLKSLAKGGNSIVVTGARGSGVSMTAFNLANALAKMGYNTLLVDLDTENMTQSYISLASFKAIGKTGNHMERVVNDGAPLASEVKIVKRNLYLLGTGATEDQCKFKDTVKVDKIATLMGTAKTQFDFIVYDTPFDNLKESSALALLSDKLILTIESSTWGIMKTILNLTNIEDDVLASTIFSKANPVFTMYDGDTTLMGEKFKIGKKWSATLDTIVSQLAESDIGLYFQDMKEYGVLRYDKGYNASWYGKPYTSTSAGFEKYQQLINRIF